MSRWIMFGAALFAAPSSAYAADPEDPRLWLEEVLGKKALDWVKQRNSKSTGELTKEPGFEARRERILKILDSKEKIPYVRKAGAFYYNFWQDEKHVRGLWRRTTLEEYRKKDPAWETVLDLDKLGKDEKESWVWGGARFLYPGYKRCLISLSRGGADAVVVREFDPATKMFVKGGFTLSEAKSDIAWRTMDSIFVGTDFGPGSLTKSGYPRVVKEWKRGTPLKDAVTVYEGKEDDVAVSGSRDNLEGYERDWVTRAITFYTSQTFLRKDGKLVELQRPLDANDSASRDDYFVNLRTPWKVGDKTYSAGSLLTIKLHAFLGGQRDFTVLFEPTERTSLESYSATKSHLILNVLDNVTNKLYVLTQKGGKWVREELPGAPPLSSTSASPVEAERSDDYFLTVSNFLTPTTLALGTLGGPAPEVLKRAPAYFDAAGLVASQHFATSKDGTKIPYFQVAPKGLPLDGSAPTLLTGYGGFEVPLTPSYPAIAGTEWMAKGGVYVVANIRGGGEFGPKWHQAALKANRHRAYEDFAAVADDLVRRKVTSVKHLGAMGGSNGGLLIGNMLTLYPEKFGALVCEVPLLDMKRYHKLLAGASWMGEYGDPDVAKEWAWLKTFSPYHNAKKGAKYPRVLFTTSTRDDRVHPGHARKMTALLEEMGYDVLLYENIEGGHGGAADNKQAAFMEALAYTFLWKQLK
jgi:prolyl oligopeptidase